jgi:pilus assembly protein CpaF
VSYTIVITEKGGKPRAEVFDQGEITIGRVHGNDIVLPKGNISKKHSRIVQRDGKFIIVDLKSTNGTYVRQAHQRTAGTERR